MGLGLCRATAHILVRFAWPIIRVKSTFDSGRAFRWLLIWLTSCCSAVSGCCGLISYWIARVPLILILNIVTSRGAFKSWASVFIRCCHTWFNPDMHIFLAAWFWSYLLVLYFFLAQTLVFVLMLDNIARAERVPLSWDTIPLNSSRDVLLFFY